MKRNILTKRLLISLLGVGGMLLAPLAVADDCKITQTEGQKVQVWNGFTEPKLATVSAYYHSHGEGKRVSVSEVVEPKSQKTLDFDVTAYIIDDNDQDDARYIENYSLSCE